MNLIKKWIAQYKCGKTVHERELLKWITISECTGYNAHTGEVLPYKIPRYVIVLLKCKRCGYKETRHIHY